MIKLQCACSTTDRGLVVVSLRISNLTIDGTLGWVKAGTESLHSITHSYYRGAAGALIVYDVTSRVPFLYAEEWLKDVRAHASSDPNLLVANKVDLVPEEEESARACSMKANTL